MFWCVGKGYASKGYMEGIKCYGGKEGTVLGMEVKQESQDIFVICGMASCYGSSTSGTAIEAKG